MTKIKGTKIKILKGEKLIYIILAILLVCTPIASVFTKAMLSESNIKAERIRQRVTHQRNTNEALTMQINELVSLDRIHYVARELGLSYNESNIKIISGVVSE